jgi:translation elongation factor EF-1alpha
MITAFNLKVKSDKKIKPREVAFYPTQEHPKIALGFTGKTMLLTYPTTREMFTAHIGKSKFLIHLGADRRQCSIKKIRRLDGSECKDMRMGELYLVDFKVNPPGIVMDTFRELNHFIITEQGLVIGGGTVEKITEVKKLSE